MLSSEYMLLPQFTKLEDFVFKCQLRVQSGTEWADDPSVTLTSYVCESADCATVRNVADICVVDLEIDGSRIVEAFIKKPEEPQVPLDDLDALVIAISEIISSWLAVAVETVDVGSLCLGQFTEDDV